MEAFDAEVIAGRASEGERQNGKGDYFNELIAFVLENASGVSLNRRRGVNGLVFADYNLDVTYPTSGIAEILIEAKMMGTPKHGGQKDDSNPAGRPASADLQKRLREAGFKTIDLKAGYGFHQHDRDAQGGPKGDLSSWLRQAKPLSYVLIAARVTDEKDLQRVIADTTSSTQIFDGLGLFCFKASDPNSASPHYSPCKVRPEIDLGHVVHRIASLMQEADDR